MRISNYPQSVKRFEFQGVICLKSRLPCPDQTKNTQMPAPFWIIFEFWRQNGMRLLLCISSITLYEHFNNLFLFPPPFCLFIILVVNDFRHFLSETCSATFLDLLRPRQILVSKTNQFFFLIIPYELQIR